MISKLGRIESNQAEDRWRRQLAEFARANERELAALSWGLWQENQHNDSAIGIDMTPTPHFIYCPKSAIEQLNLNTNSLLQEIVGVVEAFNPEKEVLIFGINHGQIKLIEFEIDPPPPVCFEEVGADVNTLLDRLEARLKEYIER